MSRSVRLPRLGPVLPVCLVLAFMAVPMAQAATLPELPRSYVDTTYVPPSGATLPVASGGNLQAALDAAQPGDVITLQAGATYTGNFTLPVKSGSGWIIVRTSAPDSSLPPAGTRIGPSYAPVLPKIVSPNSEPAVATEAGSHHFRFIGVEFSVSPSAPLSYGLVALGDPSANQFALSQVPHHLVLDRVYVHGNPAQDVRRGVALNSATSAVIDSYISEIHEIGADSQAIAGWNGPGPFKIVNNELQGAGENVLFGGADPSIPDLVPSDIEVRRNHFYKPLSWKAGDPSYAGRAWSVKNLFELKNARRVLAEGNVFENNWLQSQNGFAILFTVRNQDGSAPWSAVQDVAFRLNIVRHTGSAVNILGIDNNYPSQRTNRILVQDNVFEDVSEAEWGGDGRLLQILDGPANVTFDHNTAFQTGEVVVAAGVPTLGFDFRNNLVPNNDYGIAGDGTFGDPLGTLALYFPAALVSRNALVGGTAADYPAGNFFPSSWTAVQFVSLAGGNYRLASTSPYRAAGTDGKDLGADISALEAAMQGGTTPPPADTTPPVISGIAAASIGSTTATLAWVTSEVSDSQAEYGLTTAYGSTTPLDGALVTSHGRVLSGLAPGTLYHYRVRSKDAAGNLAVSGDGSFQTVAVGDTVPPTVSVTAPAAGASVSGAVTVTATASDSGGVAGVQFQLDGQNLGVEDTTSPYAASWTTTSVANGSHSLRAVARDAAGNRTTSAAVTVTVANTSSGTQVVWTELVNAAATGSVLRKTAGCDGCEDAGARSSQSFASGNVTLDVTASETTTQRLIGLSRGNSGTAGADVDFAFLFWPAGTVDVRENGLYRNAETTYAPGDVFRVAVASGVVRYYKNGALLYTSTLAPAYPLLVDGALIDANATLGPVTVSGAAASAVQQPYGGKAIGVPATFAAENFDRGGEGVAYHDLSAGNQGSLYRTSEDVDIISPYSGGYAINGFQTGEWLEYTISVAQAGSFSLAALVSSELSTSRFRMEIDGANATGDVAVPNTGSWRAFRWVSKSGINLTAGQHVLRLVAANAYFNVDALRITRP